MTYKCIKGVTREEKANSEIFVITEFNGQRQPSGLYVGVFSLSVDCLTPHHHHPPPPKKRTLIVFRLNTAYEPFHDELESDLKTHQTKKVKHSTHHYCTTVANRQYLTDKIKVVTCY